MASVRNNSDRADRLRRWFNEGGVMIIGYDMFRNLAGGSHCKNQSIKDKFRKYLLDEGQSNCLMLAAESESFLDTANSAPRLHQNHSKCYYSLCQAVRAIKF